MQYKCGGEKDSGRSARSPSDRQWEKSGLTITPTLVLLRKHVHLQPLPEWAFLARSNRGSIDEISAPTLSARVVPVSSIVLCEDSADGCLNGIHWLALLLRRETTFAVCSGDPGACLGNFPLLSK